MPEDEKTEEKPEEQSEGQAEGQGDEPRAAQTERDYPQKDYQKISTSTVLVCNKCHTEIPMYEECLTDGKIFLHEKCGPSVHKAESPTGSQEGADEVAEVLEEKEKSATDESTETEKKEG